MDYIEYISILLEIIESINNYTNDETYCNNILEKIQKLVQYCYTEKTTDYVKILKQIQNIVSKYDFLTEKPNLSINDCQTIVDNIILNNLKDAPDQYTSYNFKNLSDIIIKLINYYLELSEDLLIHSSLCSKIKTDTQKIISLSNIINLLNYIKKILEINDDFKLLLLLQTCESTKFIQYTDKHIDFIKQELPRQSIVSQDETTGWFKGDSDEDQVDPITAPPIPPPAETPKQERKKIRTDKRGQQKRDIEQQRQQEIKKQEEQIIKEQHQRDQKEREEREQRDQKEREQREQREQKEREQRESAEKQPKPKPKSKPKQCSIQ
jgi:hypothetical protein